MTGKRLTQKQAQRALGLAIYIHGKKCKYCGRTKRTLELDHRDGDPANNPPDGSNWAPACSPCNIEKGPHRGAGKRGVRVRAMLASVVPGTDHRKHNPLRMRESEREREREREEEEVQVRSMSAEMKKNQYCEPKFREYAVRLVVAMGEISKKDLIVAASEYADCSDQTGVRSLGKLTSLAGAMEVFRSPEGMFCIRMRKVGAPHLPIQQAGEPQQGTGVKEE